jgi:DNA-binding PucR family transcriptional regulator
LATLAAWLGHQTHTPEVAAALNVHPQTVRYRVRQLQDLLGATLKTPEGRFELALALRARAADATARDPQSA